MIIYQAVGFSFVKVSECIQMEKVFKFLKDIHFEGGFEVSGPEHSGR